MITGAAIVSAARSWIGTPYRHQHRERGVGVDCAGLVIGVARQLCLVPPDFDISGYSRQPDGSLLGHCEQWMAAGDRQDIQIGDVLITRFAQDPCHLGFAADYYLSGHLSMIHALCRRGGRGAVVEHRLDSTLRAKIVAVYRLQEPA